MLPLGPPGISRRNSNPRCGFSPYETHNIQTLNTSGLNNGNNRIFIMPCFCHYRTRLDSLSVKILNISKSAD